MNGKNGGINGISPDNLSGVAFPTGGEGTVNSFDGGPTGVLSEAAGGTVSVFPSSGMEGGGSEGVGTPLEITGGGTR